MPSTEGALPEWPEERYRNQKLPALPPELAVRLVQAEQQFVHLKKEETELRPDYVADPSKMVYKMGYRTPEDKHEVPGCAEDLLKMHAGLDMDSEHGKETPKRFLSMLDDLTSHKDCDESCIKWKTFAGDVDEMIVVKQIPFQSVCNHHVIPFVGHAWIGYIPAERIVGLSKFARVVTHFSRRLQVQERLTQQVHNFIHLNLVTKGLIVRMEAEHMCMTIRGAQAPGVTTVTTKTSGVFADHSRTAKMEFLEAIK